MIESNSNKLIWTGGAISVAILMIVGAKATMPQIMNSISDIITIQVDQVEMNGIVIENYADSILNYTFSGVNATVTGFKSGQNTKIISIPDYIIKDNIKYHVTAIGKAAFDNVGLTSVDFSNSIVSIGDWAFNHNAISAIKLPTSLQTLGVYAFGHNKQVSQKLVIPRSVKLIGYDAFEYNDLYDVFVPRTASFVSRDGVHSFQRESKGYKKADGTISWRSIGLPNIHYYD